MTIQFGCHGSTWELDYDKQTDYLEDILNVIHKSGFIGIDAQISLLGKFKSDAVRLKEELEKKKFTVSIINIAFYLES